MLATGDKLDTSTGFRWTLWEGGPWPVVGRCAVASRAETVS